MKSIPPALSLEFQLRRNEITFYVQCSTWVDNLLSDNMMFAVRHHHSHLSLKWYEFSYGVPSRKWKRSWTFPIYFAPWEVICRVPCKIYPDLYREIKKTGRFSVYYEWNLKGYLLSSSSSTMPEVSVKSIHIQNKVLHDRYMTQFGFQHIFKPTSPGIIWEYPQIVSKDRAKHCFRYECTFVSTSKSVSEALILESVNPQYDERLFIEFQEKYKFTTWEVLT